ncbi:MAG: hypothetical protein GY832_06275 [Chloroflexi bacterium]|nr:hypothetical protein [Chloroflexota bacterium]
MENKTNAEITQDRPGPLARVLIILAFTILVPLACFSSMAVVIFPFILIQADAGSVNWPSVIVSVILLPVSTFGLRVLSAYWRGKKLSMRQHIHLYALWLRQHIHPYALWLRWLLGPPSIEKLQAERDVTGLVEALGYRKDASVRQAAAESLDDLGWQPDRNETGAVYWIAKRQWDKCVELGTLAVELLIVTLKDRDRAVRRAAAEALGKVGDARAVKSLIAALNDQNRAVRRTAAEALGKVGDVRAVEPLIAALKDQDDTVRRAAAEALEKVGDVQAVDPLIAALKDHDGTVRLAAIKALEKIGDDRAEKPLITALQDKDSVVLKVRLYINTYGSDTQEIFTPRHCSGCMASNPTKSFNIGSVHSSSYETGYSTNTSTKRFSLDLPICEQCQQTNKQPARGQYYQGDIPSISFENQVYGHLFVKANPSIACTVPKVKEIHSWTPHDRGEIAYCIAFSPDGTMLASGAGDYSICLMRVSDGKLVQRFEGHEKQVNCVAFSPDGAILASGSNDKTIRFWQVSDGKLLNVLEGQGKQVNSIAFSPDGTLLASAGGGFSGSNTVLWRVDDGVLVNTLKGHSSQVQSVDFSPDGKLLASGSFDTVQLWQVTDGAALGTLKTEYRQATGCVAFLPGGTKLATGNKDGGLCIWQMPYEKNMDYVSSAGTKITCVAFSPNGRLLAYTSGNLLRFAGKKLARSDFRDLESIIIKGLESIAFSPDGTLLASVGGKILEGYTVRLWQIEY